MPEFDASRKSFTDTTAATNDFRRKLFSAREALLRAKRVQANLKRRPEHDPAAIEAVGQRIAEIGSTIKGLERQLTTSASALQDSLGEFVGFLDPRDNIQRLDDRYPILFLPVRIETRFKSLGSSESELWLRIYPDDISITAFEENLTEAEWRNARAYWAQRWAAGGDEGEHRAAWKALVKSHGSGRARWLIDEAAPANLAEEPIRAAGEILIVVISSDLLSSDDRVAITNYWQALVEAPEDATVASEAYDSLVAARGDIRASEIVSGLRPYNFEAVCKARPEEGSSRTVFLQFPAAEEFDLQETAWRHPARATTLPNQFVVMGFQKGKQTLFQLGNPVPSELLVGPDPAASKEEQIRADGHDLAVPDELKWMTDFESSISNGMGFRIPLTDDQANEGFDRVFVVGVRMSADAGEGASQLEALINDHLRSRKGCSILAQGTPTNNVEEADSSYSWREDSEVSFDHYFKQDPIDDPLDWRNKKDGRRLADALGINPNVLRKCPNYFATDQAESRAMNEALWPATLGYFMDEMADTVFDDTDISWTREHFTRHVLGRGNLPAIRIGKQPYGILTAAPFSRLRWFEAIDKRRSARDKSVAEDTHRLKRLHNVLQVADQTWTQLAATRFPMGTETDDPYQALVDALGLHPASVEYYQRFAETTEQLYNRLKLSGLVGKFIAALLASGYVERGMDLLSDLGQEPDPDRVPEILNKLFLKDPNLLKGPVVDDRPLSEFEGIRDYVGDGRNYIDWLVDSARESHDALRLERSFLDNRRPRALLYLLLHHAVDLSFVERAVELHVIAGLIDPTEARVSRRVPKFFHVAADDDVSKSPWQYLYKTEPVITGDANTSVGHFVSKTVMTGGAYLRTQLAAMERLARMPTARLERVLADHIDCCSYRLDAWWLSLLHAQIDHMRALPAIGRVIDGEREKPEADPGRGLYLGAYGWVENLRPEHKLLSTKELPDELTPIFNRPGESPVLSDSTNQGFIHAPSLDHATTAAILRNGYLSHRSEQQPDALAINLTSARVREALSVIEGVRNGQSLSALLGYRLERGLHDVEGLFLDSVIFELRRQFPLRANKLRSTKVDDDDVDIRRIEARNVLDGLALVRHIAEQTGDARRYPFGLDDKLPVVDSIRKIAIDKEVARLIDVNDAVADVAMAEGVHQLVKGNLDRAAANFDSYSKGHFPPIPDVIQSPRDGVTLTHRIAIHLKTGLDPDDPSNRTPRAKGEPAINHWLTDHLPPLADIICEVEWFDHVSDVTQTDTVSMGDLGLAPIDLLFLARDATGQEMQALDQEVIFHLVNSRNPRPDAQIQIRYHAKQPGKFSLFEVSPLIRHFESLLLASRPLRATDATLPNEASRTQDVTEAIDSRKIDRVKTALESERALLSTFLTTIEAAFAGAPDEPALLALVLDNIDSWIDNFAPIANRIARFGLSEASFAFALDGKAAEFGVLVGRIGELRIKWQDRLAAFDTAIVDYAALPLTTTPEEKIAFLIKAALLLTPKVIVPPSSDPDELRDLLIAVHRPPLVSAISALDGLIPVSNQVGQLHKNLSAFNTTILTVELDPLDLSSHASALVSLATSLAKKARALFDDIEKRLGKADVLIIEAAAAAPARRVAKLTQAMQQLTSSDFRVLPEFDLPNTVATEWQAAHADSAALLSYLIGERDMPYPVDDWLHGTARVREKMGHFERAGHISEAFGLNELTLTPLQFPYRPDDRWLGLEFPELKADGTSPFTVDEDKLLYSAHFGTGVAKTASRQCGLLCEEWTEVLPSLRQTTGVVFHYDRPNCEAPQSLLLAMPAQIDGRWAWQDIVDTLHETLDMAKKRAVEPHQLAETSYGAFLPAVISSVAARPVFQQMNLAANNIEISTPGVVLP